MLSRPVTVSSIALERILQDFGIGELHEVLKSSARWYAAEKEAAHREAAMAEFSRLRLIDRTGRVDREVTDTLLALCRPAESFYAWMTEDGVGRQVLAGTLGVEGVLAVKQRGEVTISPIPPSSIDAALIAQLPNSTPAKFQPILLPLSAVDGSKPSGYLAPTDESRQDREIRTWRLLMDAEQYGGAEIYAEQRDRLGKVTRSPLSLGYAVTEYGGCVNIIRRSAHGEPEIFLMGVSPADMPRFLHELREQLTGDRHARR